MREKLPLVSVVITTYERANLESLFLIKRALDSVLSQTYLNFEIILVIDGLSDQIYSFVKKYSIEKKKKIKILYSVKKSGAGTTRNIGIQNSLGSWIAFLDDDDEWLNKKLEHQLRNLDSTKGAIFSFSSILEDNLVRPTKVYKKGSFSNYLFSNSFSRNSGFIQTSSIIINRKLAEKVSFTNGLKKHQDWDFELKVDRVNCTKVFIKEPLSIYHNEKTLKMRTGRQVDYIYSYNWIKKYRNELSNNAYTGFIVNIVLPQLCEDNKLSKMEKITKIYTLYKSFKFKEKCNLLYVIKIIYISYKLLIN